MAARSRLGSSTVQSKYAPSTHHGVRSARIPQNPTRLLSFPHNVRRHLVTFPKFGDLPSSLESAASIFPTSRQSTANEGVHTPDPACPRRRPLVMRQSPQNSPPPSRDVRRDSAAVVAHAPCPTTAAPPRAVPTCSSRTTRRCRREHRRRGQSASDEEVRHPHPAVMHSCLLPAMSTEAAPPLHPLPLCGAGLLEPNDQQTQT